MGINISPILIFKNSDLPMLKRYQGQRPSDIPFDTVVISNNAPKVDLANKKIRNREILLQVVDDFSKLDGVEAIVLGGSSVMKKDDKISDFDVYIYHSKEIDPAKRKEIAQKYADNPEICKFAPANEVWDLWTARETGKSYDVAFRTQNYIENEADRILNKHEASEGFSTCIVSNIKNAEILFDKNGWYKNLQEKLQVPYPDKLVQNIVEKNLPILEDRNTQAEKCASRGDLVGADFMITGCLLNYFDIIFAKNKVLHPGPKRQVEYALKCNILPKDFEKDIEMLLKSDPRKKPEIMQNMIDKLKVILR